MKNKISAGKKLKPIFLGLAAVLLVLLAAGCFNKSDEPAGTLPPLVDEAPEDFTFPTVAVEDVVFAEDPRDIGGEDSSLINILMIGQDRGQEREHEGERTMADVILLCSFNMDTKRLTMTSFMRDMFVEIPGVGKANINKAYPYGGMELLDETLLHNFGIHVDANVEVDFDVFPVAVDALGGVTVEITQEEADEINRLVPYLHADAGYQHLNGAQTLVYCRIRGMDSDYIRIERQQKTLQALLQQAKSLTLGKAITIAAKVIPMVESDLSVLELTDLFRTLFPMAREFIMVHQRVPAEGTYEECIINGGWSFRVDFEQNNLFLYDTLVQGMEWN